MSIDTEFDRARLSEVQITVGVFAPQVPPPDRVNLTGPFALAASSTYR